MQRPLLTVLLSVGAIAGVLLLSTYTPRKALYRGDRVQVSLANTSQDEVYTAYRRFVQDIKTLVPPCELRIFGDGWGEHVLCDRRPALPCVFYSYGISTDFSFDTDLVETMGCTGVALDPTVVYGPLLAPGVLFLPLGAPMLDDAPAEFPVISVPELMRTLGHTRLAVLKYYAEGAEFALSRDILAQDPTLLERVDQFAFEVHVSRAFMSTDDHFWAFGELLHLLYSSGHVLAHWEANACRLEDELGGCHPLLEELGYPCSFRHHCQNVLFVREQ
jgi:hypothetical protein